MGDVISNSLTRYEVDFAANTSSEIVQNNKYFIKEFNPIIIENLHIGKGNNICVVSMSSKFANMINNLYTSKEAGVNFDVPHVHKMFICLSGMSTSIRD